MNPGSIAYLSFLISFQLLFVGIFLITHQKGNRRNNIILGLIFTLISWNMAMLTMSINGIMLGEPYLQIVDDGFFLLYGPLIYFYTKGVMFRDFRLSPRNVLHLLPFLFLTVILLYSSASTWHLDDEGISTDLGPKFYIITSFMYMHFYFYLGLSYRSLWRYRKIIKSKFSQTDHIHLDWLSFTLNTFGVITFISLIHNFILLTTDSSAFIITLILLLIFVFYFVNRVILKALRQPEIFGGISTDDLIKYKGSNLTSDQVEEHRNKLLTLMKTEKPYLNPKISLADLAQELSISSKHLSQVINQSYHKNFFDFINMYRIEEAQQAFRESIDQKLTVLEVMYRVGFGSKSSFNTAFKKETGQTPTEYRRKMQKIRSTS